MWEVYPDSVGLQPWNQVVFPPADSNWPVGGSLTAARVKSIPAIGRGLDLICGLAKQMPIDDVQGDVVLSRPRLLDQPDPDRTRPWFVGQHVEDYLVHGNAVTLITSRFPNGWPSSAVWVPAQWCSVSEGLDGGTDYWVGGRQLQAADVVHVRRGADPFNVRRGIGVVEQYVSPLSRMLNQERYEAGVLSQSAVPSVVITTPNPDLSQTEADEAKAAWVAKFAGPNREPAVLPAGTTVTPLAWSPNDSQMAEAIKLSLTDAANMLNMDGYWLGAPTASMTYQSPGPMYLNLIRQTIGPILEEFEAAWSASWLPRGRRVTFQRRAAMSDSPAATVTWLATALDKKIITVSEARVILGFGADVPAELLDRLAGEGEAAA